MLHGLDDIKTVSIGTDTKGVLNLKTDIELKSTVR
jgi:hypothetical protein